LGHSGWQVRSKVERGGFKAEAAVTYLICFSLAVRGRIALLTSQTEKDLNEHDFAVGSQPPLSWNMAGL